MNVPSSIQLAEAHHAQNVSVPKALHRQIRDQLQPLTCELLNQQLVLRLVLNVSQQKRQLYFDILLRLLLTRSSSLRHRWLCRRASLRVLNLAFLYFLFLFILTIALDHELVAHLVLD